MSFIAHRAHLPYLHDLLCQQREEEYLLSSFEVSESMLSAQTCFFFYFRPLVLKE